jgi:ADP-ribose pyrophosphatase
LTSFPELSRVTPGNAEAGEIQIVREVEAASSKTERFNTDVVRTRAPDGRLVESVQTRVRRGEGHDDGVVVAPIDESDRVVLVRQFRHPARMWLHELPRGSRKMGESIEGAARREIAEETGYEVREIGPLGRIAPDGSLMETIPFMVVARVRRAGPPHREATEAIDRLITYSFTDLVAACRRGEIIDSYTLAATLLLEPRFEGDRYLSR